MAFDPKSMFVSQDQPYVAGTQELALMPPHLTRRNNDLKVLRDEIKYTKQFPHMLKARNQIQVKHINMITRAQLEDSWCKAIQSVHNTGRCANHEKYSYHWIFYVWALMQQVRNGQAIKYWDKRQQENPALRADIQDKGKPLGYYCEVPYLSWFFLEVVKKAPRPVQIQLHKKLFHGDWEEFAGALFQKKDMDDVLEAFGKVDLGSVEAEEKEAEKEKAFGKVNLGTVETEEKEVEKELEKKEEAKTTGAMDVDG